jgi:plasmid stability protein
MATILIRNLDDAVAERLKAQAREHGVSVAEEARRILAEHTRWSHEEWLRRVDEFVARQKPTTVSSVDLIREDRDNR